MEAAAKIPPEGIKSAEIVAASTGPIMSALIEHPAVQELFKDVIEQFAYGELTAVEADQEIVDGLTKTLRRL